MIQYKSKHPYSSRYDRWYPMLSGSNLKYEQLNYEDYMYIIGDKVFREHSAEAEKKFNEVMMWIQLKL